MAEAAQQEELKVVVEPELPLKAEGEEKIVKVETEKQVVDPAEDLKSQFEDIKKRKEDAEKRASEANLRAAAAQQEAAQARREVADARTEAVDSQFSTIQEGIAAAEAEAKAAKVDIKAASEAGDFDKQAEAFDRLAAARAKIQRLDEAKSDIEVRKQQAEKRPAQQEVRRSADPVEAYIEGRTEPTAKWLRAHPEWITDQRKNAKLTAGHHDAVSEGLQPDTDEYFAHVEKFIGMRKEEARTEAKSQKKSSSAPVAPVINSGGGTSGSGTEVRLSAGEARSAQDGTIVWNYDDPSPQKKFKKGDPIGVQEMARRKLELQKQGAYDRAYVDQ